MNVQELPKGYSLECRLNLHNHKKGLILAGGGQILWMILLGVLGFIILPGEVVSQKYMLIQGAVLCLSLILYGLLHELLRGWLMRICSGRRSRYNFSGWRLYASSSVCFDKKSYDRLMIIPSVFLGILILGIHLVVPNSWKWTVYILQIVNVVVGWEDVCRIIALKGISKEALLQHQGASTEVYRMKEQQEKKTEGMDWGSEA